MPEVFLHSLQVGYEFGVGHDRSDWRTLQGSRAEISGASSDRMSRWAMMKISKTASQQHHLLDGSIHERLSEKGKSRLYDYRVGGQGKRKLRFQGGREFTFERFVG